LLLELNVHQIELELQNEELRRVQAELEKSRTKYFELFDLAPVGYLTLDDQGNILEVNLTAAHLLGLEKADILNKPFVSFIVPEFQDTFYFHRQGIILGPKKSSCELKLRRNGQEPFFALLESRFVLGTKENHSQIRVSIIDINQKKQTEEALKETASRNKALLNLLPHPALLIDKDRRILAANLLAERNGAMIGDFWNLDTPPENTSELVRQPKILPQKRVSLIAGPESKGRMEGVFRLIDEKNSPQRMVTIVEDSNDAISVFDFQGKILAWNRTAENMYGYSAAEALKMSLFDLVPSRLQRETRNLLRDIQSGVLVPPFETTRVTKSGCLLDVRLTVSRLIQNEKIIAVATTERDVSEYNRWLASIRNFPRRIIVAQEEERRRIAQEIHSDLGQNLLALKMFLVMSSLDVPKNSTTVRKVLDTAKRRLAGIITQARDLSHRLFPHSLKSSGFVEAVKKLIEFSQYDRRLQVSFFHQNIGQVKFDSAEIILFRIVQEALTNIVKHARATEVRIKAIFRPPALTLEIRDNGRGICPQKPRKTRGLGLDLLREQIGVLNGTMSIDSQIGQGTVIKISVPVREKKKNT
jgi:PAS domain S-box-containing protein